MSFLIEAFQRIGLERPKSDQIFYKKGVKRFGAQFEELMMLIEARGAGAKLDPYDKKNASLQISLYVGSHFSFIKWEAIFRWLERENLTPPTKVVDLGCECGVTTCLLSFLWPDAEVIGVDTSASAISCANELSAAAGLKNVRFVHGSAEEALTNNVRCDLIFASFFTHEWLEIGGISPLTDNNLSTKLDEVSLTPKDHIFIDKINFVTKSLGEGGLFISIDRIPHTHGEYWYVQAAEAAGLKLSVSRSYKIEANGPSGKEAFPANVFGVSNDVKLQTSADEVLSLSSFSSVPTLDLNGDVAESFFNAFSKDFCFFKSVINYNDSSGIRYLDIIKSGALLLRYDRTSKGYKHLITLPLVSLGEALNDCLTMMGELEDVARVEYEIADIATETLRSWAGTLE